MVVSKFEEAIDKWIERNEDTATGRKELFELNGRRKALDVYRLPLELLRYNIRNGRFAAELRELESRLQRRLNPEVADDAAQISQLLLRDEKQAKYLEADILRVGQLRPGVITRDGAIIDGNRRIAVLRRLYEKRPDAKFQYFEAVRLPSEVSPRDIWKIEAGIQLSTDLKASYGPVNELLKIKEGTDAGFSYAEIALILGGGDTEDTIKEKLQRLKLIDAYLEYIGQPSVYSKAERRVEHFIDLQHIMASPTYVRLGPKPKEDLITAAFEYIASGISHLTIRRLLAVARDSSEIERLIASTMPYIKRRQSQTAKSAIATERQPSKDSALIEELLRTDRKVVSAGTKSVSPETESEDEDIELEGEDLEAGGESASERKKVYNELIADALDVVAVRQQETQPIKALNRARRAIDVLKEAKAERLRPLRRALEALRKDIERLIARTKD